MIRNYFKTAIRNILKHKGYSIINIAGLAIGLAIFSLTAALFNFQMSFNQFHRDADRIYSVVQVVPSGTAGERHSAITRAPLRNLLLNEFQEIEDATRWIPTDRAVVRQERNTFYAEEGSILLVDSSFLTFFSFEMIAGDPETALSESNSVVLSESTARRYFGSVNAMGRKLTIWKDLEFVVKGVARDAPLNSSLKFDMLISMMTFDWETNWSIKGATFVRLAKNTPPHNLEQKFPAFIEKHLFDSPVLPKKIYLLALTDLNLKSYGIRSYWPNEIPKIVYLTFVIGIIMLLAVCFNFMNLTTAGYFKRAKEVGVRKVIGASRRQLTWQFFGESVLLSLIAFPAAIVLKEIMQPLFVYLAAPELSHAGSEVWSNPLMMLALLGVTIIVGIVAGSYPSIFLSRLEPVKTLRENLPTGKKGVRMRQTLIVLQLITAIFSVLVTLVSFNQYNYLLKFDVGYEMDRVLAVALGTNYTRSSLRHLIEALSHHPDISAVSSAVWVPGSWGSERRVVPEGAAGKEAWRMNTYGIDYGFIELLEMEIVQGRSFSRKFADSGSYIINQTATDRLNWDNPIGEKLTIRGKTGVVIGVVKDFHFKNLLEEIYPTVLFLEPSYLNYLYIKLSDAPVARVLNFVENQWRIFSPDMPFEYSMLRDRYGKDLLLGIKKWSGLAGLISVFIIIFSCLGLFGLASYTTQKRTKEIGIRKAHGASMANIVRLIITDFLKLFGLAVIIAGPLFYFLDQILVQDIFAYSAETGVAFYFFAGLLVLITGLLAVLLQTIKAARANPIEALRYE
jgi:putative ABC transport system permease protein